MRLFLIAGLLAASCAGPDAAPPRSPLGPAADDDCIINLYDAIGAPIEGLVQDFGLSALVRYRGTTILFDAGTNADVLRDNVEALGIDLREVDFAVASHAHFDHINGFDYLLEVNPDVTIYFPADLYWGAPADFSVAGVEPGAGSQVDPDQRYFQGERESLRFAQSGRFWRANVEYVDGHREVAPGVTLIATRSPFVGYFTRYPQLGGLTEGAPQAGDVKTIGLPELSMNLATEQGDVLLVGCSHSLVETIVATTQEELQRPIGMVYGGYHLLPYPATKILEVAKRMKDELGVAEVAPAHCTGHIGFRVFRHVYGDRYHKAGLGSVTPFPAAR